MRGFFEVVGHLEHFGVVQEGACEVEAERPFVGAKA